MKKGLYVIAGLLLTQFAYSQTFTFNGQGNWSDSANWLSRTMPPASLHAGAEIIISPADTSECVLDRQQTIEAGATLTIIPGKRIRLLGGLFIQRPLSPSGDSTYVLKSIFESYGGTTQFEYDTLHNRYTGIYKFISAIDYDSTFLFYDNPGRLSHLVYKFKNSGYYFVTVLHYDNMDTLRSICFKRGVSLNGYVNTFDTSTQTDVNDIDSLFYNSSGQLSGAYKYDGTSHAIEGYKLFYYSAVNDSLLTKVEEYANGSGTMQLIENFFFISHNTSPNPFYPWFKYHGLFINSNYFYQLPIYYTSSYLTRFSTYSPHNCTNSTGVIFPYVYTYNDAGLPTRCDKNGEGVWYYYTKVRRRI